MEFFLADWAAWTTSASNTSEDIPALLQVPAMTRRRLSRLTKIAFEVTLQLKSTEPGRLSTIFSSRHGDLHKTLGLLEQIARQEEMSPTQFALSVHNAIAGQLSLFLQNQADSNALSAGEDSLHYALLEAAARLQTEPELQQVLVIYADEPVPDIYQPFCQDPPKAIALALLLDRKSGQSFQLTRQAAAGQLASEQQASALQQLLQTTEPELKIAGRNCLWHWQRS